MSAFRELDISNYPQPSAPANIGSAPQLDWLSIDKLVVDPLYQRDVNRDGRAQIRRIAAAFNWNFFAPVIVAPVVGGKFAIIDGQHRVTAAKLIGIEQVPCSISRADAREQAAAFEAVNGQKTAVGNLERYRALLAAGDEGALRVDRVVRQAGVALRYSQNRAMAEWRPNETAALVAIRRAIEKFGDAAAIVALRAILVSANETAGYLRGPIIQAVAEVIGDHPEWRDSPDAPQAFRTIDLEHSYRKSYSDASLRRGVTGNDLLQAEIVAHLEKTLGRRRERLFVAYESEAR